MSLLNPFHRQHRISFWDACHNAGHRHYIETYFPRYGFFVTDYQGEVTLFESQRDGMVKWTAATLETYLASTRGKATPRYYPSLGWYLYSQDAQADGLPFQVMALKPRLPPPVRKLDSIVFTNDEGEQVVYDESTSVWYGDDVSGIVVPEPIDLEAVATVIIQEWKAQRRSRPFTRQEILDLDPIAILEERQRCQPSLWKLT